ncbi:hypothetical protein EKD04_017315 [Chloroflexales bacterium ZM16-3]|nr:hypothetical protein [Chloroflexales bacterium ZM16-3]
MEFGIVGRDPYYDFGSFFGAPNEPNRAAQERMLAQMAGLGARWVRVELHCGSDPDADIAAYDHFVSVLAPRYGIKILMLLGFGLINGHDPLDLAVGPFIDDPNFGGGTSPGMRRWLQRALTAARRWKHLISAYEILNEQNRLPPIGNGLSATIAARLHTKFFRLLHQDAATWPGATPRVILGGLHPAGTGTPFADGWISDGAYLQRIYESEAFQTYHRDHAAWPLDGIGYHPYPVEIRASTPMLARAILGDRLLMSSRMAALAKIRDAFDPDRAWWITELGYNAAYAKQTRLDQASFLADAASVFDARTDVATFFWFKYEDFPPASGPNAQRWGLVTIPFRADPGVRGGAAYDLNAPMTFQASAEAFRAAAQRYQLPR